MMSSLRETIMCELRKEAEIVLKKETERIRMKIAEAVQNELISFMNRRKSERQNKSVRKRKQSSISKKSKTIKKKKQSKTMKKTYDLSRTSPVRRSKRKKEVSSIRRTKTAEKKKQTKLPPIVVSEKEENDDNFVDSITSSLLSRSTNLLRSPEVRRARTALRSSEEDTTLEKEEEDMFERDDEEEEEEVEDDFEKDDDDDDENNTLDKPLPITIPEQQQQQQQIVPPSKFAGTTEPLSSTMHVEEWENEVARNIITLYRTQMINRDEARVSSSSSRQRTATTVQETKRETPLSNNNKKKKGVVWGGELAKRYLRKQIWFSGSGVPNTVWCALCQEEDDDFTERHVEIVTCDHELCTELRTLESRKKYKTYITILRDLLLAYSHGILVKNSSIDEEDEEQVLLLRRLWIQLIATGCVFATKLVNSGSNEKSLTLLQEIRDLAHTEDRNLSPVKRDVMPFIHDTLSMYYYKRSKYEAGLEYVRRALRVYQSREDWIGASKCRLHEAALLARLRK